MKEKKNKKTLFSIEYHCIGCKSNYFSSIAGFDDQTKEENKKFKFSITSCSNCSSRSRFSGKTSSLSSRIDFYKNRGKK